MGSMANIKKKNFKYEELKWKKKLKHKGLKWK